MVPDEVNGLLAAGAEESEIPAADVRTYSPDKVPDRTGYIWFNQALLYLTHG
jgi:hypothetical protein